MNDEYNESNGFLSGKGFYIALMLCVSIIAVSAWMIVNGGAEREEDLQADVTVTPFYYEQVITGAVDPVPTPSDEPQLPDVTEVIVQQPVEEPVQETVTTPEPESVPVLTSERKAYVWPVVGNTELPYSMDRLVYNVTMGDWRTHDGIDIAGKAGDFVRAACNGTVKDVYDDDLYGTTVVIDHGEGLVSYYANLQEVPTVKSGDMVFGGDIIGAIGTTALCETGEPPHLHFAMSLNGDSVDPAAYLPEL